MGQRLESHLQLGGNVFGLFCRFRGKRVAHRLILADNRELRAVRLEDMVADRVRALIYRILGQERNTRRLVDDDRPSVARDRARYAAEQGALTRPVLTDQCRFFVFVEAERYIREKGRLAPDL